MCFITKTSTYTASRPCVAQGKCTVGQLVDPGMTQASLSVPLVAPMTEYGDRINQLDLNFSKTFKVSRMSIQPKIDFFNLLNVAPVTSILSQAQGGQNVGTADLQSSVRGAEPAHVPARRGGSVLRHRRV